ncbi:MAG TPA: chromate resistance protein ChrB domain-containing protein [Thermoanaerobaculia bacterium]
MNEPWLLLIHQLPPKPDYLRAKTGRRLQRIGAVTIKNTVYVLPSNEQTLEDLQWTAREIRSAGGEANVLKVRLVDGLTDGDLQDRFNQMRDADYEPLVAAARSLLRKKKRVPADVEEIRTRAAEIAKIDFFGAPAGHLLSGLIDELSPITTTRRAFPLAQLRGKAWVTRAGVHVDRMASAWLITRFIDEDAKFRFVPASHAPSRGEIRFDMADAEFTHDGGRCTFEVLLDAVTSDDRALRAIADIVHDIDLKEERYRRPETSGFAALVDGIALANRDDSVRIARASAALDDLYAWFRRKA